MHSLVESEQNSVNKCLTQGRNAVCANGGIQSHNLLVMSPTLHQLNCSASLSFNLSCICL